MNLRDATVAGIGWTTGAKMVQHAVQLGVSILLMRMLGPESFGLIAMVLVFVGFASIFTDLGLGSALVQRSEIAEEHRSTVFWATVVLGLVFGALLYFAAPLIAEFYRDTRLGPLTEWIAVGFVVTTPATVPRALLQRAMRFDSLAKIDVSAVVLSGSAAVAAAFSGAGVWSLVIQQLIYSATQSGLALWLVDWRPRWIWDGAAAKDLMPYGAGLTGFGVINYWARSADSLLIGRFIGSSSLGIYSRAYFLMLFPIRQIVGVLGPVLFPAMSRIKADTDRVRGLYLRAMRLITFGCFPVMLGMAVTAEPFVLGLLGEEWVGVIPLIQILAFVGMIQAVCTPVGWIYTSQGRTDLMFWWGVGGAGALILAIIGGVLVGTVVAVAWAYLIGNVLILIPCLAIPGSLIGMRLRDVWSSVAHNLWCAAGMAGLVAICARLLPEDLGHVAALAVLVGIGTGMYLLLSAVFAPTALREIRDLVRRPPAPAAAGSGVAS